MVTLDDIRAAQRVLQGHVIETPCLASQTLSQVCGCDIFLKFENLQFTASFKERGALAKLATLNADERIRGVIAVSAGNHAQGVAYHAQRLGIHAVIVMPESTPAAKIDRTRAFGAEIVLHGKDFDAAETHAFEIARDRGLTLVHPFNDESVIAGQGTVALEILAAEPHVDTIVVPIGGGGLISGIAVAAKDTRSDIEVIGVQTDRYAAMYDAMKHTQHAFGGFSIADGIAVKKPAALTRGIVSQYVDDVLLVEEGEIEHAILLLVEVEKTVVEGAGAAGLAAVLQHRKRFAGKRVALVLTGGNVDSLTLAAVIQRGLARAGRLVRIVVTLQDIPGSLAQIAQVFAETRANIEEVRHQRAFSALAGRSAEVEFVLQTRGHDHNAEIVSLLDARGYAARIVAYS